MSDAVYLVEAFLNSGSIKLLLGVFAFLAAVSPVLRWWEDRKAFKLRAREVAALERQAFAMERQAEVMEKKRKN